MESSTLVMLYTQLALGQLEDDFRQGMKEIGTDELFFNSANKIFAICRASYSYRISPVVEEIMDRKSILFNEFARDNVRAFR